MARLDRSGLQRGERVLIVAHRNTPRALVKCLDTVSAQDIVELDISTGMLMPPLYELDDKLRYLQRPLARRSGKVRAAMVAVAAQGMKK